MNYFFEINRLSKIGFKKLSEADLGISDSSHQTHIGLFDDTLQFIDETHKTASAKLIYKNHAKELVCLLDFIENPDGTFRSPKIRKGDKIELFIDSIPTNSVVREIRQIATNYNSNLVSEGINNNWFLIWFGLKNNEIVFYLFHQNSVEYEHLKKIIPNLDTRGRIENTNSNFSEILIYLESQVENSSIDFLQDLEIIAQTDNIPLKIIKPRYFDIEKAKKQFEKIGKYGEELIAKYLDKQKFENKISSYKWINQSRESGFPYDFEINNLDGKNIFTDVKTTSYKFEQKMVFSKNEIYFIEQNSNYHIYRVYDIYNESPTLKVCENINLLSNNIAPKMRSFESNLMSDDTSLHSMNLAISPTNTQLEFTQDIELTI